MTTTSKTLRTNVGSKHPELYRALTAVAVQTDKTALAEGLSPLLIELVKIRASQINGCAFCLRLHTKDSLAKGESPERLSVLPAWRESMYFDEQERWRSPWPSTSPPFRIPTSTPDCTSQRSPI